MTEFELFDRAAAGMRTQRSLLDIAARNVAAAQTVAPGKPFPRLVAELDSGEVRTHVVSARVDALTEMIGVLDAQRAYEMSASIFDTAKRLSERTIEVGRL
jgi:flagellar basal body rod protein FlgC